MVPHASEFRSTLSDDIKIPTRDGVFLNVFLFFLAPIGYNTLLKSDTSYFDPSIPMKLSSEPATAIVNGLLLLFVTSYLMMATGIPLASGSPGINGLKTLARTETGMPASLSVTCANG